MASTQSPEFHPQHKDHRITAVRPRTILSLNQFRRHPVCLLNLSVKMEWIFSYRFCLGSLTWHLLICCYVGNLVCFCSNVTKCPAYGDLSARQVYCSMSSARIQTPSSGSSSTHASSSVTQVRSHSSSPSCQKGFLGVARRGLQRRRRSC